MKEQSDQELERMLKSAFADFSDTPDAAVWENVQAAMPAGKKKRAAIWWWTSGMAAAIALAALIWWPAGEQGRYKLADAELNSPSQVQGSGQEQEEGLAENETQSSEVGEGQENLSTSPNNTIDEGSTEEGLADQTTIQNDQNSGNKNHQFNSGNKDLQFNTGQVNKNVDPILPQGNEDVATTNNSEKSSVQSEMGSQKKEDELIRMNTRDVALVLDREQELALYPPFPLDLMPTTSPEEKNSSGAERWALAGNFQSGSGLASNQPESFSQKSDDLYTNSGPDNFGTQEIADLNSDSQERAATADPVFSAGVTVNYQLSRRIGIESGLLHTTYASTLEGTSTLSHNEEEKVEHHFSDRYIGVPLTMNFRLVELKRFSLLSSTGGITEIRYRGVLTETVSVNGEEVSNTSSASSLQDWNLRMELGLGAAYRITRNFSLVLTGGSNFFLDQVLFNDPFPTGDQKLQPFVRTALRFNLN